MVFSLIIPCRNEEKNIRAMYDEINKVFSDCDFQYEMLFVNDGSDDNTAKEIKKLLKLGSAQVIFLDFSRNFGKESAIYAGLEHCRGDFAVIIDGDLQQPPAKAYEMLQMLLEDEECDCVAAYQEKRIENKFVGFLKKWFYKVINRLTDVKFVSDASDFRVMRRNMIDAVLSLRECGRFSKGIFAWTGFHTKYIPYIAQKRNAGETKWNLRSLFKYARAGIIAFSAKFLKIPSILSAICFAASIIYLVFRLCSGEFTETSAAIFLTLFMSAIVLAALGVVCIYLSGIYSQSKQRPIYVLRDKQSN